ADYKENLRFFIKEIRKLGGRSILMTPNALAWTDALQKLYGKPPYKPEAADGFNITLKEYVAAVRTLAKEEDVPLVDIFAQTEEAGNTLLLDGMHPNTEGQKLVADQLLPE